MSRLTCKYKIDNVLREMCTFDKESDTEAVDCVTCQEYCSSKDMDCGRCDMQKAFDKLAEYENLEEQGLLLRLPCKIGTTVYVIDTIYECRYSYLDCPKSFPDTYICETYKDESRCEYEYEKQVVRPKSLDYKMLKDFGKTVFLTREQAEQSLKRLESAD